MPNKHTLEYIKNWFNDYTNSFIEHFPDLKTNILIKINHSKRVSSISRKIAQANKMDNEMIILSEITGLLHDIGRFEQYTRFQTFSDDQSLDHGDLGGKIIEKELKNKPLDTPTLNLVKRATQLHNKKHISGDSPKEEFHLTATIRDADKVDIYKIVTDHYQSTNPNTTLTLDLPDDNSYTHRCIDEIKQGVIVNKKGLRNVNDFKLLQISWVFDLNYKKSLELIVDNQYLDVIFDTLPQDEEIKKIRKQINQYIKRELAISKTSNEPVKT